MLKISERRLAVSQRLRAKRGDDSGFSLMEMVIAFGVLTVFAVALGITLVNGLDVSKASRQRVAAANLAAREIEIVRNKFMTSTADAMAVANAGTQTNVSPLNTTTGRSVVDGVSYSVTRSAEWLPLGNGANACDGGTAIDYPSLKVSVAVSWPNMRTAKPVVSQTLLTPPKGTLDSDTLMFVGVKVQKAAGTGSNGVVIQLSGPGGTYTDTTDATGCAFFQVSAAGTYQAVADMPGWVDQTGIQHSVKAGITVTGGNVTPVLMTYDQAATLRINLVQAGTNAFPATIGKVNFDQPNVPASSKRRTVALSGNSVTVTGLWPSADGYDAWAGGCTDSDPAANSSTRVAKVPVTPGGTSTISVNPAPIRVTVKNVSGVVQPGLVVTATSTNCSGGGSEGTLVLGTTNSNGQIFASIPWGGWTLSTTIGTKLATATLTSGLSVPTSVTIQGT